MMSTESFPAAEKLGRTISLAGLLVVNPTVKELHCWAKPELDEEKARDKLSSLGLDLRSPAMDAAIAELRDRVIRLALLSGRER